MQPLSSHTRGDQFSPSRQDAITRQHNALINITPAGGGVEVHRTPYGTGIVDVSEPAEAIEFEVQINDTEDGAGIYSGARIEPSFAAIDPTKDLTPEMIGKPAEGFWSDIVVVNASDAAAGEHSLSTNDGNRVTVRLLPILSHEDNPRPVAILIGGGGSEIHPCRVQQVGGVNGDATHDCTYTYDIYQLDNTTKINTGTGDGPFTPKNHFRMPKTPMTAGTRGDWYFDQDGVTRILRVDDERPTSWKICET